MSQEFSSGISFNGGSSLQLSATASASSMAQKTTRLPKLLLGVLLR